MKKIILISLCFLFALITVAQNNVIKDANAITRTVDKKFNAVEVSGGIQLLLSQSGTPALAISASTPADRELLITKIENGVLKIYYDYKKGVKSKNFKVYVSAPEINSIEGSAGAQIDIDGSLSSGELKITLSSGSTFHGGLRTTKTTIDQSSGSVASINGSGDELAVKTSSGAKFKGYDFVAKNCNADVSSGAIIETTVNEALNAEASSGGRIRYKGKGNIVKVSTGSGGSVNKFN